MNIALMRAFVSMRKMLFDSTELRMEIEFIKRKLDNHGKNIELVFQYLDEVAERKENAKRRNEIGFRLNNRK